MILNNDVKFKLYLFELTVSIFTELIIIWSNLLTAGNLQGSSKII